MDRLDRKILRLLQEDSTLAVADLAKKVGLSTTPCWRRRRAAISPTETTDLPDPPLRPASTTLLTVCCCMTPFLCGTTRIDG